MKPKLKPRDPNSYKGQNGKVLVIGGSKRYFGSPALVAMSSLRAGADLAYLCVPEYIAPAVATSAPDLIVWAYPGEYLAKLPEDLPELARRCDALAIGNGLTKDPRVLKVIREIVASWKKPVVIDADAIMPGLGHASSKVVYTPHVVEFQRLSGEKAAANLAARKEQVRALAQKLGATVLLKGKTDIASDGKTTLANTTGNAGMTAGGTGDTLAGICATFLAQGYPPIEAAFNAAYINGAAGDLAFRKYGYSLIASDIICEIPAVLKQLQKQR